MGVRSGGRVETDCAVTRTQGEDGVGTVLGHCGGGAEAGTCLGYHRTCTDILPFEPACVSSGGEEEMVREELKVTGFNVVREFVQF